MNKPVLFLLTYLFCIITGTLSAQTGYFPAEIKTKGGEVRQGKVVAFGLIQNPKSILFTDGNQKETSFGPADLESFSIKTPDGKTYPFVSRLTGYDLSAQSSIGLTENPNPEIQTENLFLLVLLEGEASLYKYVDNKNRTHFYFEKKGGTLEYLLYKQFVVYGEKGRKIVDNKQYLYTLNQNMQDCPKVASQSPKYAQDQLIKMVEKYLECIGKPVPKQNLKESKLWSFSAGAGVNINFLSVDNISPLPDAEEPTPSIKPTVSFSVDRAFKKSKRTTSLGLEANYRYFDYAYETYQLLQDGQKYTDYNLKASYLNLNVVFKHALSQNSSVQPFVLASVGTGLNLSRDFKGTSLVTLNGLTYTVGEDADSAITNQLNASLGFGVAWKRFSTTATYRWGSGIFYNVGGDTNGSSKESGVQVMLAYRLTK